MRLLCIFGCPYSTVRLTVTIYSTCKQHIKKEIGGFGSFARGFVVPSEADSLGNNEPKIEML